MHIELAEKERLPGRAIHCELFCLKLQIPKQIPHFLRPQA
jgi:hypothetical protein